jgi:hypothetical protein
VPLPEELAYEILQLVATPLRVPNPPKTVELVNKWVQPMHELTAHCLRSEATPLAYQNGASGRRAFEERRLRVLGYLQATGG